MRLLAVGLCVSLFAQAPPAEEPKGATVEGTVVQAGSKQAIRKAKVSLVLTLGAVTAYTIEADDLGQFTFKDVKPGAYRLLAEKTGYQKAAFGAKGRDWESGQVLRITGTGAFKDLTVPLPKHGVITGRVIDADGEPVQRVFVFALASVYSQGKRIRYPAGAVPTMTNDLGEYRLGQLPPDRYQICVVPFATLQPSPASSESKPAVEEAPIATYYPGTVRPAEAIELEIKDAAELPGIDIRLAKQKTVNVRGQITGLPANPGVANILALAPKGSGVLGLLTSPRSVLQASDGRFEFKGVPPGSYILHNLQMPGPQSYLVKTALEVGEQPISDLNVPVSLPFEIKGQVVVEGGAAKLADLKIALTPADEVYNAVSLSSLAEKGDFTAANLTGGRYRISFVAMPPTHYVRTIRLGEQEVAGDELEIPFASAGPLTLTLTPGPGTIGGDVRSEKDEPVAGAYVALIRQPKHPFWNRVTRTDQNGGYRLPNLPPGEYLLFAVDSMEPGMLADDEFVKKYAGVAKKVKVVPDSPLGLALKLAH